MSKSASICWRLVLIGKLQNKQGLHKKFFWMMIPICQTSGTFTDWDTATQTKPAWKQFLVWHVYHKQLGTIWLVCCNHMATWHLIWPFGLAFSQASLSALMEWSNAAFEQRKAFSTHLLLPASSQWFFLQTRKVSVFSNHLHTTQCASLPAYNRWPHVFPSPAVSISLWPCSQNRLQVSPCSQTGFSLQPPLSTVVAWYVGKPVITKCQS